MVELRKTVLITVTNIVFSPWFTTVCIVRFVSIKLCTCACMWALLLNWIGLKKKIMILKIDIKLLQVSLPKKSMSSPDHIPAHFQSADVAQHLPA